MTSPNTDYVPASREDLEKLDKDVLLGRYADLAMIPVENREKDPAYVHASALSKDQLLDIILLSQDGEFGASQRKFMANSLRAWGRVRNLSDTPILLGEH